MTPNFIDEMNASVMLCDTEGKLVYMNDKCAVQYADKGGREMIGTDILECHPEPARTKLIEMIRDGRENIYTIEKKGTKKIIIQMPWKEGGAIKGMAEFSIVLPDDMPHYVRE